MRIHPLQDPQTPEMFLQVPGLDEEAFVHGCGDHFQVLRSVVLDDGAEGGVGGGLGFHECGGEEEEVGGCCGGVEVAVDVVRMSPE